jgi:hypothetical protein
MSDSALEMLAIWLFVPALVLIVVLAVLQRNQVSRSARPGNRQEQRNRLTGLARESGGSELVVDWISFRDLAKAELTDLLVQRGWHYHRQEIVGRQWQLVFVR